MKKKQSAIIEEFEGLLKSGRDPNLREFGRRYPHLSRQTYGMLVTLRALYDKKKEMSLPAGFGEEQHRLAADLVAGKHPRQKKFIHWESEPGKPLQTFPLPHPLTKELGGVPVVNAAAAGEAIECPPDFMMTEGEFEKITRPFDLTSKEVFALEVKGDSLEPLLSSGSRVYVDPRLPVRSGRLAVIVKQDYSACVKKVLIKDEQVILISANPEYPPQELPRSEIRQMFLVTYLRPKR